MDSSRGGGVLEGQDGRPAHPPKEIGTDEWMATPLSVQNYVSKFNYVVEINENAQKKVEWLEKELKESKGSLEASKAKVAELESGVEAKDEDLRVKERENAALKLDLEESEKKRKASKMKASNNQQKLKESQNNAEALQLKLKTVESDLEQMERDKMDAQTELEGVKKQLDDQVSKSEEIIKNVKAESDKWKMMASKFKAFVLSVSGEVSGVSDEELEEDDDISQDQLTDIENILKSRLQKGEENKNLVMELCTKGIKINEIEWPTESQSHQPRNTDQHQLSPPPNSSSIQNEANE